MLSVETRAAIAIVVSIVPLLLIVRGFRDLRGKRHPVLPGAPSFVAGIFRFYPWLEIVWGLGFLYMLWRQV